jgi:hypothetical protein
MTGSIVINRFAGSRHNRGVPRATAVILYRSLKKNSDKMREKGSFLPALATV